MATQRERPSGAARLVSPLAPHASEGRPAPEANPGAGPAGGGEELRAARAALLRGADGADGARAATWHWNLRSGTVEWSAGVEALFGYAERVTDAAWRESRIHPDERQRVALSLQRATVVNDGSVWSEQYRFRKADGSYVAVVERAYVLHDEQGPHWVEGTLSLATPARRPAAVSPRPAPRGPSAAGSRRSG